MFPMCHIYFANEVLGQLSCFSLLGSIYPDIAGLANLSRNVTHYNTADLYEFFKFKDVKMKEFAMGAVTHGVDLKGLDYYSDEMYPGLDSGYCFYMGKEIENEVIECCRIPREWGLWKAHNFIEMAFDLYLCRRNNWIEDFFNRTLGSEDVIDYISNCLGEFYSLPSYTLREGFIRFIKFSACYQVDVHAIVKRYAFQLREKHGILDMNTSKGEEILLKALDIVKAGADDFFELTVQNVRETTSKFS